jgi:hypothetical protein
MTARMKTTTNENEDDESGEQITTMIRERLAARARRPVSDVFFSFQKAPRRLKGPFILGGLPRAGSITWRAYAYVPRSRFMPSFDGRWLFVRYACTSLTYFTNQKILPDRKDLTDSPRHEPRPLSFKMRKKEHRVECHISF